MYTKFPYEGAIDFGKYLDEYLKRENAIHAVPTDAELKELARKSIVREQLELRALPAQEPAMAGDTAVLKVIGTTPKFNKERVTVTLGRGLYNKDLENALMISIALYMFRHHLNSVQYYNLLRILICLFLKATEPLCIQI